MHTSQTDSLGTGFLQDKRSQSREGEDSIENYSSHACKSPSAGYLALGLCTLPAHSLRMPEIPSLTTYHLLCLWGTVPPDILWSCWPLIPAVLIQLPVLPGPNPYEPRNSHELLCEESPPRPWHLGVRSLAMHRAQDKQGPESCHCAPVESMRADGVTEACPCWVLVGSAASHTIALGIFQAQSP